MWAEEFEDFGSGWPGWLTAAFSSKAIMRPIGHNFSNQCRTPAIIFNYSLRHFKRIGIVGY